MASAISMRGAMFWMTFDGTMNSALFTEFLDLLIHDIGGKIFLIVDHVKYHTSRETSEWVKEHKDRIELFFLPSYSPDLNPTAVSRSLVAAGERLSGLRGDVAIRSRCGVSGGR